MKKLLCLLPVFFGMTSAFAATDYSNWTGKLITFYVTNNTSKTLEIAPAWANISSPELLFPQGTKVAPNQTIYYQTGVSKKIIMKDELGTIFTALFAKDADNQYHSSICNSRFLVGQSTKGTFQMSDYPNDGLFVATKNSDMACSSYKMDYKTGTFHMTVDPKVNN